jgi:hypothetical protein
MSADNFILIRKAKGKFVNVMGFASDERVRPTRASDTRYDTLEDAIRAASKEYTEYGIDFAPGVLPKAKRMAGDGLGTRGGRKA